MRLAVCASHPIQYQAPMFRELARRVDLLVLYADRANPSDASDGFFVDVEWDVDLLCGYESRFLKNVASRPGVDHFGGCDSPEVGGIVRSGGFDAVLLLGWHLKVFHQALIAAKLARLPVLQRGDSHLGTPRSAAKRLAKRLAYPPFLRLFDAALAVGQNSRDYWLHYGYPARRIFFAPHGVDDPFFRERATAEARSAFRARLGAAQDEILLLFVGKLGPKKRPVDLIDAAARLRQNGRKVRAVFAGSGPLDQDLAAAARSASVPVDMLGFCNQSEMPAIYAGSDILVLSSSNETWGLVANEALACGVPLVLSDAVGSAPDLVGDDTAGRSYPVGDIDALAHAVTAVIDRPPSKRAIAGKAGLYSVATAADGIVEAMRFVTARRL